MRRHRWGYDAQVQRQVCGTLACKNKGCNESLSMVAYIVAGDTYENVAKRLEDGLRERMKDHHCGGDDADAVAEA